MYLISPGLTTGLVLTVGQMIQQNLHFVTSRPSSRATPPHRKWEAESFIWIFMTESMAVVAEALINGWRAIPIQIWSWNARSCWLLEHQLNRRLGHFWGFYKEKGDNLRDKSYQKNQNISDINKPVKVIKNE